jgi:hypothetical protein
VRDGRTSGMESKKGRRRGEVRNSQERCSHWRWWRILIASENPLWAGFFVSGQSGQAISPSSEVPSDFL